MSYAPEGEGPGSGKQVLEMIKDYLVNSRGIDPDRLETIYGGRNSNFHQSQTELWVVPQGAHLPKPVKHETNIETFQGLFDDSEGFDDFGIEYLEDMGPGIGDSTNASFADMLHQQKNAVPYIVVYSGEALTPGAWRRLGQKEIDFFKAFNVEPSRFKLIFGGHQKETRIQYWILPNSAPPPVADAGSEKPLDRTIKAGDFNVYNFYDENSQKEVFSRLADVLTLDKTVRAFLVVRLEQPEPEEETEPQTQPVSVQSSQPAVTPTEPVEPEPPLPDLTKLVEKWRDDLATTHKIGPDRFIIVFTTEDSSGRLSLWFVPKGAPLPNPKEEEEKEGVDPER